MESFLDKNDDFIFLVIVQTKFDTSHILTKSMYTVDWMFMASQMLSFVCGFFFLFCDETFSNNKSSIYALIKIALVLVVFTGCEVHVYSCFYSFFSSLIITALSVSYTYNAMV